jgi:hypothetical protein
MTRRDDTRSYSASHKASDRREVMWLMIMWVVAAIGMLIGRGR